MSSFKIKSIIKSTNCSETHILKCGEAGLEIVIELPFHVQVAEADVVEIIGIEKHDDSLEWTRESLCALNFTKVVFMQRDLVIASVDGFMVAARGGAGRLISRLFASDKNPVVRIRGTHPF